MKKLHSIAVYALATPFVTLGAGSLLAQDSSGHDYDREQETTQRGQGAAQSAPLVTKNNPDAYRAGQSDSQTGKVHTRDQSRMQSRGYMLSAPANGMQATDLIGAEVKTSGNGDVGSVHDLIIDENGQIVAVVVGVGRFLGMAEKSVAIGWDDVKRSGSSGEQVLQIDVTREDLRSAPELARLQ